MPDESIPTHGGKRPECPDCGHAPHWLTECRCGCAPGKDRKAERDNLVAGSKGDASRPSEGFY